MSAAKNPKKPVKKSHPKAWSAKDLKSLGGIDPAKREKEANRRQDLARTRISKDLSPAMVKKVKEARDWMRQTQHHQNIVKKQISSGTYAPKSSTAPTLQQWKRRLRKGETSERP